MRPTEDSGSLRCVGGLDRLGGRWRSRRLRALPCVVTVVCGLGVVAGFPSGAFAAANANWAAGIEAGPPANAGSNPTAGLESVSCPSAGNCTAVGGYIDTSGYLQGMLSSESSGVWAPGVEAPLPLNAQANPDAGASSVSCASAGNCTAVGMYFSSSDRQGLLLSESSGSWTAAEAPLPSDAGSLYGVILSSVSCPSVGNCTAVGSYLDSSSVNRGLLLSETSGSWTAVEAPLPGTAGPNPNVHLVSVSCASVGNCTAVGFYADGSSHDQGLLLSETSGSWAVGLKAPLPAYAAPNPNVSLGSVSCASVGNCAADGEYTDALGNQLGLLLTETSGSWATGVAASVPANAATNPDVFLGSVSCPSAGSCAALGSYTDSSGHHQGLVLSESSGTWATGVEAGLPAGAGTDPMVSLDSLSCSSAGNCVAVGYYRDSSNDRQGLLLSESSGMWATGVEASLPANAGANPNVLLSSVSCASVGNCAAVGFYNDSSSNQQGLLLGAAAASPSLALQAPASGAVGSSIAASSVAALLSGGLAPIGTVTFTVFGPQPSPPSSCNSDGTPAGSAAVSGDGTYSPSGGFIPAGAGDYWWYASYGGDASDNPAASVCGATMPETVVASTGSGGGTAGGGPGGATGAGRLTVGRLKVSRATLRVTLSCAAGPCDVTLELGGTEILKGGEVIAESAFKRRHKVVTLARETITLMAGQSVTIKLALNATGKRLLAKFHRLEAKLTVSELTTVVARKAVVLHANHKHFQVHTRVVAQRTAARQEAAAPVA